MCSTSGAHYRQCAARTPAQRASAWKADRPDRALQGCQAVAVAVAQVAALQIQIQRRLQMIVPIRTITQHARDEITWSFVAVLYVAARCELLPQAPPFTQRTNHPGERRVGKRG